MTHAVRYSDTLSVQVQPSLREVINQAAQRRGVKPTEYMRQRLAEAVKADGFDPATIPARDAGALYDSHEGQQRYAMVEDGQIKFISYHDEHPGDGWVSVEHRDSEPFDINAHWRLSPVYSLEAGRVVCTYPVVSKALETV